MRVFAVLLGAVALVLSGAAASAQTPGQASYDIVVVGGEEAVGPDVFAQLESATTGTVERLSGGNRYATAAAVSAEVFDPGVPVAFVATGEVFPDALVAGPVAARLGGPVLLTQQHALPDPTRDELERLQPGEVVLLGGQGAVSADVRAEIAAAAGAPVERVAGDTRFATATELSRRHYSPGVPVAYVATAWSWPDALSAVPAAAVADGPILLADPLGLPATTRDELARLQPDSIVVLGGRAALPDAVMEELEAYTDGEVERVGGRTREETATRVSEHAFPAGAGVVYFATSADFPDALAVGAVAGAEPGRHFGLFSLGSTRAGTMPGPVLLTPPASLPVVLQTELERLGKAVPPPRAEAAAVDTAFETPVDVTLEGASAAREPLTFEVATSPGHGALTGDAPSLTYTPDSGFFGEDSFTFTVADTIGVSKPATVTITVLPPPPTAGDVAATTDQDEPVVVTLDGAAVSGTPLTYEYEQPDDGTVTGDGPDVTYTPDPGFHGVDTFAYRVRDAHDASAWATVTVTVEPAVPVAHDVHVTTLKDDPIVVTLDVDGPTGVPLTYHYGQPDDGTVTGSGPDVTYTPDPGFEGSDSFTFHVNDGDQDSNTATVTVDVEPEAPEAHDVAATTGVDEPAVVTLDATVHGAQAPTFDYTQPAHGTVTGVGPDVTYTPDAGFIGVDDFTFRVHDGFNWSDPATVTVDVQLVAEDYEYDAIGNTLLEVGTPASGDPALRVDATLLDDAPAGFTVEDVGPTDEGGTVDWDADGTFTYRPPTGFSGQDRFEYTIGDGEASGSGTVTVTVDDLVWYVDGDASGDGTAWDPFASLADAEAASGPDDVVFVHEASGVYDAGIALQSGQRLLGEAAGLDVGGEELVTPGGRPAIDAAAGDAIVLAAGAEVRGIDVSGSAGHGIVAANTGGAVTVDDVTVADVTGDGVRVTGSGDLTLTDVEISGSGASAVALSGVTGVLAHSGTIEHAGTDEAVVISSLGASADVALGSVTSTGGGVDVASSAGDVAIDAVSVGTSAARLTGASAVAVDGGVSLDVGQLDAWVDGAAGLDLAGGASVTIAGGTVDVDSGPGLVADDAALDVTLASLDSTGSATSGIALTQTTGTVDIGGGAISGSAGDAVAVTGGSVSLATDTDVTNAAGHALRVDSLNAGEVTLGGDLTDTGEGIELTGNTGSTIVLSGVLDVDTDGDPAFHASGGGTVSAGAAGSTLQASGAAALKVTGTTIGASGLRFRSIVATNAQHGIELDSTGAGGLIVEGDGSASRNGSGGLIDAMSGHGVHLVDAGPVVLRNMNVRDNTASGVAVSGASQLRLVGANIVDNSSDDTNEQTRNNVFVRDATGSISIEDSLVVGSVHNQIDVESNGGALDLAVVRTTVRDNDANSGLLVEAYGSSDLTVTVQDSVFSGTHATGVHAFARDTSTVDVTVDGSDFDDNNVAVNVASWHSATMTSAITNNDVAGHPSHAINVTSHDDSLHETTVVGNVVDGAASASSVGIRVIIENESTMRALLQDNDVHSMAGSHGIRVMAREGAGQAHLTLRDNVVEGTEVFTWPLEVLALDQMTMCTAIDGNQATSNGPSHLLLDVDTDAFAQIEGTSGTLTEVDATTHLQSLNPGLADIDVYVYGSATGVAAGTCQTP